MSKAFFTEQQEQSQIKSRIVSKYFSAWANIILGVQKNNPTRTQRMAYIDLFAGPGRFEDGSKSTPLQILEIILARQELAERMVTLFNDKNASYISNLQKEINKLAGLASLRFNPQFSNYDVGEEIQEFFQKKKIIPAFIFVDPWGYKGLSMKLLSTLIGNWGSDCIFFFNYNRINMGINNEIVQSHMISLFGEEHFNKLKKEYEKATSPAEHEAIVIQSLISSLREQCCRYVLPFRFKNIDGTRTSHHLIFLSNSFTGYAIMKEIMMKESTVNDEGFASFEYNPRDIYFKQGSLLESFSTPLENLKDMLKRQYAGQILSFKELYREHSVDRPYVKSNYQNALKQLMNSGEITAVNSNTGKPPRKGTFSEDMIITFGGVK